MITPRYLAASSLYDGRWLVTGGTNGVTLKSSEFYSSTTNTWTAGPELPGELVLDHCQVQIGSDVFVVGKNYCLGEELV